MQESHVSNDDVQDVLELSKKIEDFCNAIFDGNQNKLSLSSLIIAVHNLVLQSSRGVEDIMKFQLILDATFDESIEYLKSNCE